MVVTLVGMVTEVRLRQDWNAEAPIEVTLEGIVYVSVLPPGYWMRVVKTLLNKTPPALAYAGFEAATERLVMAVQELNALLPMVVMLEGIATDVSLEQPKNAESPMVVTLAGMVTEVRPEQ